MIFVWISLIVIGVWLIVWGAETFAENLGEASVKLRVSSFALAILLAGAEPEELATTITSTLRDAPAIAFGDVIGANIAIFLVALGIGAIIQPLPFGKKVMCYALFGFPIGVMAVGFIWDGKVTRLEGVILLLLYVVYLTTIWLVEKKPPAMGETGVIESAKTHQDKTPVSKELLLVVAGLFAMMIGSIMLVETVRNISHIEEDQTMLALTVVGFATAFELVILCYSAAKQGATEVVIAGVVGSFAYNITMTLGAAAVIRPLSITDATLLHKPAISMLLALLLVILLALPKKQITSFMGWLLVISYPIFLLGMLI
ncbi:MAG: sodium:calcium antiporter [Geminocystis sp. GBBB08]|nr:sodium:calcium antiporter [Geminocystis sp. GBBB08]